MGWCPFQESMTCLWFKVDGGFPRIYSMIEIHDEHLESVSMNVSNQVDFC